MNKTILIGRVVKDIELRFTSSGVSTVSFTIAVNRNFNNANGEREANFINCVAWKNQAENVSKYCSKGSQVAIEGRIQVRSYEATDGTKKYVTEVVAENITFLGSKESGQAPDKEAETTEPLEDPFLEFSKEINDEQFELPF